ncbi:MAG: hypothetical protein QOD99_1874 [Chthoniobacter sp.]|nr:hypothetical protein [Chthoniobacter sp.]
MTRFITTFCLLALLSAGTVRAADDGMDAETKAAIEGARKNAGKMPVLQKLMTEEAEKKDEEKPAGPTTKPEPLTALPPWIPPVPGFKPESGSKHWMEKGIEKGELRGVIAGAPRAVATKYHDSVKATEKFNVTVNDVTINDTLTMTVSLTARDSERKVELELKPTKGGKASAALLTYTAPPLENLPPAD